MLKIKSTSSKTGKDLYKFVMTEGEFRAYDNDSIGFCIRCSEERGYCEPDARKYECEDGCGERMVYGATELLLSGLIEIIEGE